LDDEGPEGTEQQNDVISFQVHAVVPMMVVVCVLCHSECFVFFSSVSEERTASIFRVTELVQANNPFMRPEDGGITLLRNIGRNEK
jgi:hypothetical protein